LEDSEIVDYLNKNEKEKKALDSEENLAESHIRRCPLQEISVNSLNIP